MYHTLIQKRIRRLGLLHSATLELTYSCNLDCFFCYNDTDAQGVPLSFEQYRRLLEDLAEMQVLFLTLTGGEPLAHPRFFEIAALARTLGFALRVKSSGHAVRGEIARRLRDEVNPMDVEMSLHGATPTTHDRQTRVPGSFERLVENIEGMRAIGLRASLVSTLTAWNADEIEAMYDLAERLEVRLRWQGPVSPRDNGDREPLSIQPSVAQWDRWQVVATVRNAPPVAAECEGADGQQDSAGDALVRDMHGDEEPYHCGIGGGDILIDPFGNLYPCLHVRWSAGNLHEQSVKEIWAGEKGAFRRARDLSVATAKRFATERPTQLNAPLYCPGVELKLQGEQPERAAVPLSTLQGELARFRRPRVAAGGGG
ncbi:radical SAM protein [Thiocapsa marina]|uniref:Radical SAM domain protein n=1 Tax=Thiocapsa marina 5811 TaxID=768671 RepID=F9UIW6_9GAMM|nr:radical SAM protein [Thiocapsa marina]EGV15844.1 Radical SAM domain protein [Thiocapsa marina 5811]